MPQRPIFFEMAAEAAGFDHSFTQVISALKRGGMQSMIGEKNVQRFAHGRRWRHRANDGTARGEMQTLAVEWACPFQEVVDGDLDLIPRSVKGITEQMSEAHARMVYKTISEACDASGQTVDAAAAGSNADAFLDMLNRIEFGVDPQGNVTMPEIHAGEEAAKAMIASLEAQPPEFAVAVERIKSAKTEAALARERDRKSKFKSRVSA